MENRRAALPVAVALALLASACAGDDDSPAPPASRAPGATEVQTGESAGSAETDEDTATTVRIVSAGDIASTRRSGRGTARLVERLDPDLVLTVGDHAYPDGSIRDFRRKYRPTWGRFRDITRPVPGNHEYRTPRAAGYFRYFDEQVDGRRWYAYEAGPWRVYALNCEIRCGKGSPQHRWLKRQLERHGDRPSLAQVHRPYLTCSPQHPPYRGLRAIWRTLDRANGQLVLGGHVHGYERFAPVGADRERDGQGMRQLVVGTGGAESHPVGPRCAHRQEARGDVDGVLELTLHPDRYAWRFVAVGGDVLDEGERRVRWPALPLSLSARGAPQYH